MLFVCYPKCTTCQKARAFLEERAIPYEFRDIKLDNPQKEELREWQHRSGLPLKRFFNTSGLQYKALGLKDRLPGMDEEEQLDLLAADGMLVKRPILAGEDFVLVGFKPAEMGGTFWKKRRERLTSAEIVIKYCGKCDDGAKRSRQPEARGERCEPSAEAAAQATPERPVRSGTDDPPLAGMLRGRSAPERACSGDQGGTVVMIRP